MMDALQTPPNWPRLNISLAATAGTVTLAGTITPVTGASLDDTCVHALEVAIAHTARIGRPTPTIRTASGPSWSTPTDAWRTRIALFDDHI